MQIPEAVSSFKYCTARLKTYQAFSVQKQLSKIIKLNIIPEGERARLHNSSPAKTKDKFIVFLRLKGKIHNLKFWENQLPQKFISVYLIDDEVVAREEEAIKLDGLNVAQIKEMREKAEKFAFQAEVNRMMKLIINSLYRNKEVGLYNYLFFKIYFSYLLYIHKFLGYRKGNISKHRNCWNVFRK